MNGLQEKLMSGDVPIVNQSIGIERNVPNEVLMGGRILVKSKDHSRSQGGYVFKAAFIAEKVFGKPLPSKAIIHHADMNKLNDSNNNLVICENIAYHLLLHTRIRAYKACGHADWRKCRYCKKYDDLNNLSKSGSRWYHKECARNIAKKLKQSKN